MELNKAIHHRRSVRRYLPDVIDDATIRDIVQAGMAAPSAGNVQARYFYIVTDSDLRQAFVEAAYDQKFLAEAPVAIVVCTDSKIEKKYGDRGRDLYTIMDCAASIQNILLAAYGHGLGSCWVGAFDEDKVRKLLNLPENQRSVAIIPIGRAGESPDQRPRVTFEEGSEYRH